MCDFAVLVLTKRVEELKLNSIQTSCGILPNPVTYNLQKVLVDNFCRVAEGVSFVVDYNCTYQAMLNKDIIIAPLDYIDIL
jgi:hypothetical protein